MLFDGLFNRPQPTGLRYATMPDSYVPIYTQNGRSVYSIDIVQSCIDRIASHVSKYQIRHIRRDQFGRILPLPGDSLNKLFKYRPNPYMTTRQFLEKTIWCLELNDNAFVYPMYDIYQDSRGFWARNYIAFYPLMPMQVNFEVDTTGKEYIRMRFLGGKEFVLPREDVIHLKKKYSNNDIMGGGVLGQPDNDSFAKTITVYQDLIYGVAQALQASMKIKGMIKLNTALEPSLQRAERLKLEEQLVNNNAGIISGDYKSEFQSVNIDPKIIEATTLAFVENKILRYLGVSVPVLNGTPSDTEKQAFYSQTIEPIIIDIWQAFTANIFTPTELSYGNEIVLYTNQWTDLSPDTRIKLLEQAGPQGVLKNNEKRDLLGYEPLEGPYGEMITQSLNFIDIDIISQYQLARAGIDAQTPNTSNDGGTTNASK